MKKEAQNILRIRIAANILYRINREFTIEYKDLDIYDFIVQTYPTISKGTVYRNLSKLTELGKIKKVQEK